MVKVTDYYQATTLVIVRLFVVVIYGCHGDGRNAYTKYHGHTYYNRLVIIVTSGGYCHPR